MKGKIVKTRKQHECKRCHHIIPEGVEAIQALGGWRRAEDYSGYWSKKYYCMKCFRNDYVVTNPKADEYGNFEARLKQKSAQIDEETVRR